MRGFQSGIMETQSRLARSHHRAALSHPRTTTAAAWRQSDGLFRCGSLSLVDLHEASGTTLCEDHGYFVLASMWPSALRDAADPARK